METFILTIDDIKSIVQKTGLNVLMDEMINRLESGLLEFDDSSFSIPPRDGFEYERPDIGLLEWMPILKLGEKAIIKIVGYHPLNPNRQKLPTVISSLYSFDTVNGHLIALSDGTFLTALRTGAASAVASKLLGYPDSRVMGMIGCGAQAVSQVHALSRVHSFEKILAFDIDSSASQSFKKRTEFIGIDVHTATLSEVLSQSDILSTATSIEKDKGPLFQRYEVKPWLHINAVGSDFTGKFEIPLSLLRQSLVTPDSMVQALVEGECQQLQPHEIGPILTEIVKNQDKYQSFKKKITVFDSTGWAFEDQLAMEMITERASKLGLGTMVQIESHSIDPKNPYEFLGLSSGKSFIRGNKGQRLSLIN